MRARWTVLFSDESRFLLSHADGCTRGYRCQGDAPNCVHQVDRFGGGSHVAGALTGIRYEDKILQQ